MTAIGELIVSPNVEEPVELSFDLWLHDEPRRTRLVVGVDVGVQDDAAAYWRVDDEGRFEVVTYTGPDVIDVGLARSRKPYSKPVLRELVSL